MHRAFIASLLALVLATPFGAAAETKADKARAEILRKSQDTLAMLYKAHPEAKALIAGAAGYGTFTNYGLKIFLVGGSGGKGVVVNNNSRQVTYMKMVEAQAGLGLGLKKFRVVFVFQTQEVLDAFVDKGWEFGGQATAAAKAGEDGGSLQGAATVAPGLWMYQLTETGLAVELTARGTKYWKDGDLN